MANYIVTKAKLYHQNGDTQILKLKREVSDVEVVRTEIYAEHSPKRVELTYTEITDDPE